MKETANGQQSTKRLAGDVKDLELRAPLHPERISDISRWLREATPPEQIHAVLSDPEGIEESHPQRCTSLPYGPVPTKATIGSYTRGLFGSSSPLSLLSGSIVWPAETSLPPVWNRMALS